MLSQIAKGIASQFGPNCEVVVHEISEKSAYSSIVAIENGHVSGRKVGDGPSHVVLEQIGHDDDQVSDQLVLSDAHERRKNPEIFFGLYP